MMESCSSSLPFPATAAAAPWRTLLLRTFLLGGGGSSECGGDGGFAAGGSWLILVGWLGLFNTEPVVPFKDLVLPFIVEFFFLYVPGLDPSATLDIFKPFKRMFRLIVLGGCLIKGLCIWLFFFYQSQLIFFTFSIYFPPFCCCWKMTKSTCYY